MKRPYRVILEVFGPTFLAVVAFIVPMVPDLIAEIAYGRMNLKELLGFVYLAYAVGGIPSVIYAVTMEIAFARGLNPKSWRYVIFSSAVGLVSGILIDVVIAITNNSSHPIGAMAFMALILVGTLGCFFLGLTIKILAKNQPKN